MKPDVVLMDIQLPGMSGIDCVAELRRIMPSVNIIMVTVYEDNAHLGIIGRLTDGLESRATPARGRLRRRFPCQIPFKGDFAWPKDIPLSFHLGLSVD
jgi:CheY-like chemotaxis protein